jgi:hypothetical protein
MYGNTSGVEQIYEFLECMNSSSEDGNVLVHWKQEYNNQAIRFPFVRKERERIFLLIFPKESPATELH